jgi:hypothetical protein
MLILIIYLVRLDLFKMLDPSLASGTVKSQNTLEYMCNMIVTHKSLFVRGYMSLKLKLHAKKKLISMKR